MGFKSQDKHPCKKGPVAVKEIVKIPELESFDVVFLLDGNKMQEVVGFPEGTPDFPIRLHFIAAPPHGVATMEMTTPTEDPRLLQIVHFRVHADPLRVESWAFNSTEPYGDDNTVKVIEWIIATIITNKDGGGSDK